MDNVVIKDTPQSAFASHGAGFFLRVHCTLAVRLSVYRVAPIDSDTPLAFVLAESRSFEESGGVL